MRGKRRTKRSGALRGITLVGTVVFLVGCAGNRSYVKVSEPAGEGKGTALYQRDFAEDNEITSVVRVSFTRNASNGGIYEVQLDGELSYISASILFPEDIDIIHSQATYRYKEDGLWYEKTEQERSKFQRVLAEELSPAALPGHLPFGVGGGYTFMRKLASKELEEPEIADYLENTYDPVDVVFIEKKGIDGFQVRIPVSGLKDDTTYTTKIIAQYHDGFDRELDDDIEFSIGSIAYSPDATPQRRVRR